MCKINLKNKCFVKVDVIYIALCVHKHTLLFHDTCLRIPSDMVTISIALTCQRVWLSVSDCVFNPNLADYR